MEVVYTADANVVEAIDIIETTDLSSFVPKSTSDYYSGINSSATDNDLKGQLHSLISHKTTVSYDNAWKAFAQVDKYLEGYPCSSDHSQIPDIYSDYCWHPQKNVSYGECGTYKKEGDCYNREHSWPKSWFGGYSAGDGAQTDLFELWPSDGYVNGMRANLPFGYVKAGTETYTSTNGCVIGECASSGYSGKCFEMADYLKGDLARTYFYLTTAYYKEWSCCDEPGSNNYNMKTWMEDDMRAWHNADPVTSMERQRNDAIYSNW
jgi:endonuclease I